MRNGFAGLLVAAIMALPMGALADDDCQTVSEWKPTEYNTGFSRVKVQITVVNKTDSLVTAQFTWKDTAGKDRTEQTKAMTPGQTVRNVMEIRGADGTADFTTDFGDIGAAQFQVKFRNAEESRFLPMAFPDTVKCDRNYGNNNNIWKIDYVLKPKALLQPTPK